jgi:hypothetical protein
MEGGEMRPLIRFVAVSLVIDLIFHSLSWLVRINPDWPLWGLATALAATVELILWLYQYEAAAVTKRRARSMIGLRLAVLTVFGWILIEPMWVHKAERTIQRQVVVVLDDSGSMHLKDGGADATRIAIGEAALAKSKILEKLSKKLTVHVVKAARSVRAEGEAVAEGWGDATDLASALGSVLQRVPPNQLAGVILVSDGRHNRPNRVEDFARRFGILDAPVGIVAVGSETPPKDAAILAVRAPEAIHLGDRMKVSADLKFDGYNGEKAQIQLRRGNKLLEQREISVPQDHYREEVKFVQIPDRGGVGDYQIKIMAMTGERFKENNLWEFETSITDARTNVLIVESYPRWEFRYLRNLFYGRDKSVHLQYVLLHPDEVEGQGSPPVAASASRPFGEALATRLPVTEDEWRKFDIIILGDVDPQAMNDNTWNIISRCVNERAAMLVILAGPRFMPHAIDSEAGRALVPAEIDYGHRDYFNADDKAFRFGLTADGKLHPVTQQSTGDGANGRIWSEFPALNWRHPVTGMKVGAEVLLTSMTDEEKSSVTHHAGLTEALNDLAKRREREAQNAILVTRQTGKGKVALLLTDQTWRLREGAGDLYHHRFWGNLVRWGAGPILRSGGDRARLGTDQLIYTPEDRVKITARLRDKVLQPVKDDTLCAEAVNGSGKVVNQVPMTAVANSNGLYEATMDSFSKAGKYEIRLRGDLANHLIIEDGAKELKTELRVARSLGPIELGDTTMNLSLLETIASLSSGRVVSPDKTGDLASLFLTDKSGHQEIRETTLWDNGWVLSLIIIFLVSEWLIRRAGGLP